MTIDGGDLGMLAIATVTSFLVGRVSRKSNAVEDHATRLAVINEKIEQIQKDIGVIERNERTLFRKLDMIGGKRAD